MDRALASLSSLAEAARGGARLATTGLSQTLLPEFEHELVGTRKTLERVPEDKLDWRPHPKSMTLGGLATHVANLPSWLALTLERDSFDMAPVGQPRVRHAELRSRVALLAHFDRQVAEGRAALIAADDARMLAPWSLLVGGKALFTLPRAAVVRSFCVQPRCPPPRSAWRLPAPAGRVGAGALRPERRRAVARPPLAPRP